YSHLDEIDKLAELSASLRALLGARVGRLGCEPRTLPAAIRDALDRQLDVDAWVDVEQQLELARAVKTEGEIERIRRAAAVADTVQQAVKERARPGVREVDLAAGALAEAWSRIGRRFPILIQLKAGPATAVRGDWHPGRTVLREGDVVCTDTAP